MLTPWWFNGLEKARNGAQGTPVYDAKNKVLLLQYMQLVPPSTVQLQSLDHGTRAHSDTYYGGAQPPTHTKSTVGMLRLPRQRRLGGCVHSNIQNYADVCVCACVCAIRAATRQHHATLHH